MSKSNRKRLPGTIWKFPPTPDAAVPSTHLVYPFPVSTDLSGRTQRKTWGFAQLGDKRHANITAYERLLRERNNLLRTNQRNLSEDAIRHRIIEILAFARRGVAVESTHFMKVISPRERTIRSRLIQVGVPIEQPIQVLSKGRKKLELFERGDYRQLGESILSKYGGGLSIPPKQYRGIIQQVGMILARMHTNNITHGHAHLGNFLVNKKGQVKLIDLTLAKQWDKPPQTKSEFLERYGKEMWYPAAVLSTLLQKIKPGYELEFYPASIMQEWLKVYRRKMNTFNLTGEDIVDYLLETEA